MEDDTPPIFDHRLETFSQKSQLHRCDFALQRDHPDSQFSPGSPPQQQQQNDRNTPPGVPGASDKIGTDSVWRPDAEENATAVDLEQEKVDRTVRVVPEEQTTDAEVFGPNQASHEGNGSRVLEKPKDLSDQPVSSGNQKDGSLRSPVKESGRTELKIPLREVVKAIVLNSRDQRNREEEDDIEKMSYVQLLMTKGFKFPD